MEHTLNLSGKKYTFLEKKRNVKEILQLYITDYMIKRDHPEIAREIAEKVNIEMSECQDENFLEDWWAIFWPQYKSSAQEPLKLPSEVPLEPHSSNSRLQHYIYGYLMKLDLYELAIKFADEANLEMTEMLEYDEDLLENMWRVFWPQYYSRMTNQMGGNSQSSTQNVVRQPPPPEGMFQAPPENSQDSQRRAGKHPLDIDIDTILGPSKMGKGPLGFPLVNLHPNEVTLMTHSRNSGNLQMLGSIQAPQQIVGVDHSFQLQPTYQPGQDLAYPLTTPIAGENIRNNQGSLTGDRGTPDGPRPESVKHQVPVAYFEMMQQEAEERRRREEAEERRRRK